MKFWNSGKWASVLASCVLAILCGASLIGISELQGSRVPAAAGKVVILQADGAAPPPAPPVPTRPAAVVS